MTYFELHIQHKTVRHRTMSDMQWPSYFSLTARLTICSPACLTVLVKWKQRSR